VPSSVAGPFGSQLLAGMPYGQIGDRGGQRGIGAEASAYRLVLGASLLPLYAYIQVSAVGRRCRSFAAAKKSFSFEFRPWR
jgi:hypothetical protein